MLYVCELSYTLVVVDLSKWPMEADHVDTAIEKSADMCHIDEKAAMIVLYPVPYKGLMPETTIKRVRLLEDRLMNLNLTMDFELGVSYSIPDEHGNEKRPLYQKARLLMSKSMTADGTSSAWLDTMIARGKMPGTIDLIRVREMVVPGRTPTSRDRRLGPGERVQQLCADGAKEMLKGFLHGLELRDGDKVIIANPLPAPLDEWSNGTWRLKKETGMSQGCSTCS